MKWITSITVIMFLVNIGHAQSDIDPKDTMSNRLRLKALNQEIELGKGDFYTYYNRAIISAALKDTVQAFEDYGTSISMNGEYAPSYIHRGVLYQKRRNLKKAEGDFTTAIKLDPGSAIAVNNRGFLYLEMGQDEKALSDLNKSIEVDKNHAEAYMNKVDVYARRGDKEAAIGVCTELISALPEDPKSYTRRSHVYTDFGLIYLALADQNRAVELSGNDPAYLIERSRFKDDIGDDRGSLDDCDLAIKQDPNVAHYHLMRSRPLYDLQEFGMVLESCDKALDLDPNEFKAMVMKANVLDAYGMSVEAEQLYEKAILVEPSDADAYIQLSILHYAKQDFKKALQSLQRYTDANGDFLRVIKMKGQLYGEMGDFTRSIGYLDKFRKLAPGDPEGYYLSGLINDTLQNLQLACEQMIEADKLGSLEAHRFLRSNCRSSMNAKLMKMEDLEEEAYHLEIVGDFKGALLKYNEAIAIVPDSARLYYNRGKAKRKLNDHKGAIEDYKKGIAVKPSMHEVDFWVSIGVSYSYLNDLKQARASYEEAIKVDPTYAVSYYNLGLLDAQNGNFKEAVELIKESLLYNPNYILALVALGDYYLELGENKKACETFMHAEALGETGVFGKRIRACRE